MNITNIVIPQEKLGEICRRYYIKKLAFFGSVLRDDFRPDSDVDILVEFEVGHVPGFDFFAIEEELSELIKRRVELHTSGFLSTYFRDEVMALAEVQYAKS